MLSVLIRYGADDSLLSISDTLSNKYNIILVESIDFNSLDSYKSVDIIVFSCYGKDTQQLLKLREKFHYTPIIILGEFNEDLYERMGLLTTFIDYYFDDRVLDNCINNFIKIARITREREMLATAVDRWKKFCVLTDKYSGEILYANKYTLEVTGYELEDIIGKTIQYFCPDYGNDNRREWLNKLTEFGFSSGLFKVRARDNTEHYIFIDSYACNGFVLSTGVSYTQTEEKLRLLHKKIDELNGSV